MEIEITNLDEAFVYGRDKFLTEKVIPDVDASSLFVAKVNKEWRCTLFDQGIEESSQILKVIACVEEVLSNHVDCLYKLSKSEFKVGIDVAKMKESFAEKAQGLKDAKEMAAHDCLVIAQVQSLTILIDEQINTLETKLEKLQNYKCIWEQRLDLVSSPN